MPACEQTSSLPGEPDTPTAPTTSLPDLTGRPPPIASTRVYCREPTEAGSSSIRLANSAERARGIGLAVGAFRRVQAGAVAADRDDRQAVAIDDRHRNLEAHAFALRQRGIGDGLRHRQRNVPLCDQPLCGYRR